MPQPNKIPKAFAASGDRNIIPESTGTLGLASWNEGFPAITSAPFSEGGIAPKRADFNGIFNALSVAALWYQQGGFFVYDNATNYEIGNIVIYSGEIYVCKTANGPASALHSPANDTAETYWGRIYPQNGTFDQMFFSQTSGTYTAPRTGVYRITLKGGGGGGGAYSASFNASGGGGGEGGEIQFYITLTKGQIYPYVIGAGGTAAPNVSDSGDNRGGVGGSTIFNNLYFAYGGNGGRNSYAAYAGGGSGGYSVPTGSVVRVFSTQSGHSGAAGQSNNSNQPQGAGKYPLGSGGAGGGIWNGTLRQATAGSDGYILIEYAGG